MTAIQLALLVLIIEQFSLEDEALLQTALVAFGGFLVQSLLPLRLRMIFFALLSMVGIATVVGPINAFWLIATGLLLIALCHLPIAFRSRIGLLLSAGTVLTFMRLEWIMTPWPEGLWPILGSFFMFRLIVYLHYLRHEPVLRPALTLSYFFMLPNVCFPLFPVVDFKTFRNSHYAREPHKLHQEGVRWMLRGVLHLMTLPPKSDPG